MAGADEPRQLPGELERVLAAAPSVIYTADVTAHGLQPAWVSANVERIFGYTVEEALAPGWWWNNIHPEDRASQQNAWLADARFDRPGRHEHGYRFRHGSGGYRWVHDQLAWEPCDAPGRARIVGSWMDVSAFKQQEEQLVESEERFRQLVSHVPQVFWMDELSGELLYISPSYERVWGRSIQELYTDRAAWRRALHPEDRERVNAYFAGRTGAGHEISYRIIRPDGAVRWILDRGFPVRDADGKVYRKAGIAEDVTENALSRRRLQASEAHYRRLITTSPYAVYMIDALGAFAELNPAAERLLGRTSGELLGQNFQVVIAPEAQNALDEVFREMIAGRRGELQTETVVLRPDGERRLIVISATSIVGAGGFDGAHGIARDITEERAREQRVTMLAEALDRLPDGVSIEQDDGTILYANDAYRELVDGVGSYDLTGLQALLPVDTPDTQRSHIRELLAGTGGWRGRTVRQVGERHIPLEIVARRVELDRNLVTILLARDVTEQVEREQQLRRTERLASIGTLVGGVAHELNNPLTAIAGFIELMLAEPRSGEDCETLELMRRETARVGKIVNDLRLLARESQDVKPRVVEPVDVNDIIEHVLKIRRYALQTSNIEVQVDLTPQLPPARGVASEIEQVVLNLVVNASQSMEASGRARKLLTIRSARMRTGVAFEVIDNGGGIPERVMERIFDPFFTTKSPGEGTGLGLSLVYSIVSEHEGRISVNSIEGRGAAFTVWLPLAGPEAAAPAIAREQGALVVAHPLRVLVVDDEAAIRLALVRHLRRRGHEVQTAGDGAEALERIAGEPFDVIVSDIRMPGMSGDRLLRVLLERGAEDAVRRLVFMTGDPASESVPHAVHGHDVPVVPKPFTLAEITRAIEERAANGA